MKLSAYHKAHGDDVEWWHGFTWYDRVYMSRIFDSTYTPDPLEPVNCTELIKGGTGWSESKDLPPEVEHIYPDYGLYGIQDTAYGFLTRGCPRGCPFCIVSGKEGRKSHKVADLSEWWDGQPNIELMDPNLLACKDHMDLIGQLVESRSLVNINQGLDARLLTKESAELLGRAKIKQIHFAWDKMEDEKKVLRGLDLWRTYGRKEKHGMWGTVYLLGNYGTSLDDDLYRIETISGMGFNPYVMIYDKPSAPKRIRYLQRWCNNKRIFKSCSFVDYDPARG